jgi:hypothetical protein
MYFGLFIEDAMLLIYSEPVTSRLRYIARLMLGDLFGIETSFTEKREEYLSWEGPKINYSLHDMPQGFRIRPVRMLQEKTVYDYTPEVNMKTGLPFIFPSQSDNFPFDIFAASFFMVTRYEEYSSSKKDKYGRFLFSNSFAKLHGFERQPVVNLWTALLVKELQAIWPALEVKPSPYRFVSTIDVDHAYAYKYRTILRTLGGIGRSLGKAEFGRIGQRMMVLAGLREDPYDTFGYIRSFHRTLGIRPHYFILFADYGGNDNNVSIKRKGFRQLVAELADETAVGIHPSLSSNRSPRRLEQEISGLANAAGREIRSSRQHFLKFSFPKTFRHLVTNGITDDFSMGYASAVGFRAGIASPFRFFDLYRNETTPLTIHPVAAMDVTFRDYLNLSPGESIVQIKQLADIVRSVNGEFVSLWHNESLSGTGRWEGWREVFEETTAYAAANSG